MPLEFDIHDDLKKELNSTYSRLEVIVERIKKIRNNFTGFTEVFSIYGHLINTIKPISQFINRDVLLTLKVLFSIFMGFIVLTVVFPFVSGFARMPWIETFGIILASCGLAFVNMLRRRLGVSI